MGDSKQETPEGVKTEEKKTQARPAKLKFMDSLKFNLKKWSSNNREAQASRRKIVRVEPFKPGEDCEVKLVGCNREAEGKRGHKELVQGDVRLEYHQRKGGPIVQVERETGRGMAPPHQHNKKRRTSFELFLSSIPKLDPVDRTVGWVLKHPDLELVSGWV